MLRRLCILIGCLICAAVALTADDNATAYRLGPQDEFSVTVLRHPELSANYTVPPDGMLDFPRAGRMNVIGKTAAEISDALKGKYAEFLVDPTVTAVLTRARVRHATIMGAVARPAQYPITDTTRVADLIALAGDVVGEKRELTASIKRGAAVLAVDLQAVLSGNKPEANLQVQEGDQLTIIAPTKITVVVIGQVKNPNPFKLAEGCTPVDALAQAGDVTARPERLRITLIRGAEKIKLAWGDTTTKLRDGDVIQVENEAVVRVTVNGSVRNSGGYDLLEGGGVMEAIALAGGIVEDAAIGQVTIIRAKDNTTEHVDLTEAFSKGVLKENPKLYPGDQVLVPKWDEFVSVIGGGVNNAGKIKMTPGTEITVVDAISQAGVDQKRAKLSEVVVVRRVDGQPKQIRVNVLDIIKKNKHEQNIVLQPRDIVYVPDGTKITDILPFISLLAAL